MTKTDFFEVLTKKVQAAMGPDYEVKVLPVRKNNDTVLNGMTILSAESNVSPTIYLDDFWMKYCGIQRTIGEIVDEIIECYNQHKNGCSIDVEWIRDYSKAKDKLIAVLVNKSKNAKLLENVAHKEHLDLAIVYKLLVDIAEDGSVSILAKNRQVLEEVKRKIQFYTAEAEIGKVYRGLVKSVRDFGAFVEILPGQEGLLHISEMANYRVNTVTDICKEGDYVAVKVIEIDERSGKIRLSRKAALDAVEK
jgi:ribosomal protein S1